MVVGGEGELVEDLMAGDAGASGAGRGVVGSVVRQLVPVERLVGKGTRRTG